MRVELAFLHILSTFHHARCTILPSSSTYILPYVSFSVITTTLLKHVHPPICIVLRHYYRLPHVHHQHSYKYTTETKEHTTNQTTDEGEQQQQRLQQLKREQRKQRPTKECERENLIQQGARYAEATQQVTTLAARVKQTILHQEKETEKDVKKAKAGIKKMIEKLSERINKEELFETKSLAMVHTISELILRKETDSKQALALFALAKKANCAVPEVNSALMSHFLRHQDGRDTTIYEYFTNKDNPTLYIKEYNSIIRTFAQCNRLNKALEVFVQMKNSDVHPNLKTFKILLYYSRKDYNVCLPLFQQMAKYNIAPDTRIYNIMIHACKLANDVVSALMFRDRMVHSGVPMDLETYNFLLGALLGRKKLEQAHELFQEMRMSGIKPNANTYGKLFISAGYTSMDQKLLWLKEMEEYGIEPNITIYMNLLDTYGRMGDVRGVAAVFDKMQELNKTLPPSIQGTIIKALCECGWFDEGYKLLEAVPALSPEAYASLLWVSIRTGKHDKVPWIYDMMIQKGQQPDCRVYLWTMAAYLTLTRYSEIEVWMAHMIKHGDPEANLLSRIMSTFPHGKRMDIVWRMRATSLQKADTIKAFIENNLDRLTQPEAGEA